ncbi:MAG: hypothetical protein MUC91_01260 [Verrucomicrobia bacterium]|jgi:hypothetical protein|nr:hypothetical protein [Verrucomicrobiota bacterium]
MIFDNPWLLLAAGSVVAAVAWFVSHHFSRDAKLTRRRRRSNARVEPTVNRPVVKLSVQTGSKKRKRRS